MRKSFGPYMGALFQNSVRFLGLPPLMTKMFQSKTLEISVNDAGAVTRFLAPK